MIADLRQKFGVGLWDVPLRELLPLIQILHRDPTSWLFAAVNGWDYPTSREALTLADMFDAYVQVHTRKGQRPKPYLRPFSPQKKYGGRSKNKRRSPEDLSALFAN